MSGCQQAAQGQTIGTPTCLQSVYHCFETVHPVLNLHTSVLLAFSRKKHGPQMLTLFPLDLLNPLAHGSQF